MGYTSPIHRKIPVQSKMIALNINYAKHSTWPKKYYLTFFL
jgi:hypothetical protein